MMASTSPHLAQRKSYMSMSPKASSISQSPQESPCPTTIDFIALSHQLSEDATSSQDQVSDLITVLCSLGLHLFPLNVINLYDLPAAQETVFDLLSRKYAEFHHRILALESPLQACLTAALVLCASCHPMPIYPGFGSGLLKRQYYTTTRSELSLHQNMTEVISALQETPKNFWLLKKLPAGMDSFTPREFKIFKNERKQSDSARTELAKKIEKKGFPQPHNGSFKINSWWIPFAGPYSTSALFNEGHSFERVVRWQTDPGRLLYAFIVNHEINLREGECMLVPSGTGECLVRWLEGLNGFNFKIVPESDLNFRKLGLNSSTSRYLWGGERRDAYVIRDPKATSGRSPFSAPSNFSLPTTTSTPVAFSLPPGSMRQDSTSSVLTTTDSRTQSVFDAPSPMAIELPATAPSIIEPELPGDSIPLPASPPIPRAESTTNRKPVPIRGSFRTVREPPTPLDRMINGPPISELNARTQVQGQDKENRTETRVQSAEYENAGNGARQIEGKWAFWKKKGEGVVGRTMGGKV